MCVQSIADRVAESQDAFRRANEQIARLTQRVDAYSLMEKVGDAGIRAKELDPRAAGDG